MKKFIMAIAAALCLAGCSTSSEDVIYELVLAYEPGSFAFFGNAVDAAYKQIDSKMTAFSNEYVGKDNYWVENISNGKTSSADKSAKAKYNTAKTAFDKVCAECNAIIDGLSSGLEGHFELSETLKLKRTSPSEGDSVLCESTATFKYPKN